MAAQASHICQLSATHEPKKSQLSTKKFEWRPTLLSLRLWLLASWLSPERSWMWSFDPNPTTSWAGLGVLEGDPQQLPLQPRPGDGEVHLRHQGQGVRRQVQVRVAGHEVQPGPRPRSTAPPSPGWYRTQQQILFAQKMHWLVGPLAVLGDWGLRRRHWSTSIKRLLVKMTFSASNGHHSGWACQISNAIIFGVILWCLKA